jgi:deoxyribose-phosphate aldolase
LDGPELHSIVTAITDRVLAPPSRAEDGRYPCGWECNGCRQRDAEACAENTSQVVAAGACRVSSCTEVARRKPDVAGLIDHTLLKPEAMRDDIVRVCREARQYGFASVCVNPYWVPVVASELAGSCVKVCAVAGFPLGATSACIKRAEAEEALCQGAQEIDMVINVGALRSGDYEVVDREIREVAQACHRAGAVVKTILETALLDDRQKAIACALAKMAGADFVKTSTGFGPAGATVEDVALMRLVVGPEMGIKAAGGIRTLEDLRRMVAAGATRIGASASVKIAQAAAT